MPDPAEEFIGGKSEARADHVRALSRRREDSRPGAAAWPADPCISVEIDEAESEYAQAALETAGDGGPSSAFRKGAGLLVRSPLRPQETRSTPELSPRLSTSSAPNACSALNNALA